MSIERKLMDLVRRSNAAGPGMTGQCEVSACYVPHEFRCFGQATKEKCDEARGIFGRSTGDQSGCPSVKDLCRGLMIRTPEMD